MLRPLPFGYCGSVLRVDLSTRSVSREEPPADFYRRYFGGEALIAYYLLREMEPGVDAFDPGNLLIFATGVLTGHSFSGSGRNSVGGKSPLTGGLGASEVGGYWGSELKKAGFDGLIIKGACDEPSYLWIHDGDVEVRDARHLWGKMTGEVEDRLRKELGEGFRVAQIGPAGERKVRYACVVNDLSHFAGRTGLGAVMGSKNLKAVAVKGSRPPASADPAELREKARWVAENPQIVLPNGRSLEAFRKHGTGAGLLPLNAAGGLPTRNFGEGVFEYAEEISGERMSETILTGTHTCFGCVIRCKRNVRVDEPYKVDPRYGGPEYETLASLGSNCGVRDLKAIAKANEICNTQGIDTISAGVAISFAMDCFENGLITERETGGALNFGNAEAMLRMVSLIAERSGFGRLLGEGVKRAAKETGKGAERFAVHVKGLEVPMHEPRLKKGLGLGYVISPTGADHIHNMHDTLFQSWSSNMEEAQALGILQPIPANRLNGEKVRLLTYISNWRHFADSALLCYFTPWYYENTPSLVKAVTGWNTTTWELVKVGERAATMARIFNLREGITAEEDVLPEKFGQPFRYGPTAGEKVTTEEIREHKKVYYRMMGWSDEGTPTREKLYELDIGWAEELLPKS
ncbi:MAG: aldehyde ferredoxin oxidoreductase family protein [Candidatus Bathyarchaeia archaeon]